MRRAAAILLACLAAIGCMPAVRTTLPSCPGANGRAAGWADYFPARTFDLREDFHNEFTLKWFGGELASRNEPVLSCPRPGQGEAYRLLYLPSFRDTWTVRVEKGAEGAFLEATRTPCGGAPKERRQRTLTAAEWDGLTAAVAAADFWKLPTAEKELGEDGETWVVEGLRPGAYHAARRWGPEDGTPYRALGATFLELAGLGELAVVPVPTFVKPTAPEDLPAR
jgi:hypothetical protein